MTSATNTAQLSCLVTGAGGLLGEAVVQELQAAEIRCTGVDRSGLDITDSAAVSELVGGHDWVINCAAYTSVDAAESDEAEAFRVNALGPSVLARACAVHATRLLHVSTDYVFDGKSSQPYRVGDRVNPVSAYGRTKLAGEWAVRATPNARGIILRTAWLYGRQDSGSTFVGTIVRIAQERGRVDVVNDQRGQPTWAVDLARRIRECVNRDVRPGIYHATSTGSATWYDFAIAIVEHLGLPPDTVHPTDSATFARPAPRPANSVLDHAGWEAVGLEPMRPWREAFESAWPELGLASATHKQEH